MSIQDKDSEIVLNYEQMRTDWLVLEKERLERKVSENLDSQEETAFSTDRALIGIKSELSKRQDRGDNDDYCNEHTLHESYH